MSPSPVLNLVKDEINSYKFFDDQRFAIISDKSFLTKDDKSKLKAIYDFDFDQFSIIQTLPTNIKFSIKRNKIGLNHTIFIPDDIPDFSKIRFLLLSNGYVPTSSQDLNPEYSITLEQNCSDCTSFDILPAFVPLYLFSDKEDSLKIVKNNIPESNAFNVCSFSLSIFLVFLAILFFRLKLILTNIQKNNFWFVTTGGCLLSKPVPSYYTLLKDFMRNFSSKKGNIICCTITKDDQVILFKFLKVCKFAYLVIFNFEESMDEYLPNFEMNDGSYRCYDMASPKPVICRTTVDPKTQKRQLQIEIELYKKPCTFTCTPNKKCLSFGLHCIHAQYVHRIYIGILIQLLKIETQYDFDHSLDSVIERLDFSGVGFFSIENEVANPIILKYKDEVSKDVLIQYASKFCGQSSAVEVVTMNIGNHRIFGNRVKIGQYLYVLCVSLPKNLLTIRASERQFQGFFSIVLSFHQIMNQSKQYQSMKRLHELINKNKTISFSEYTNDELLTQYGTDSLSLKLPDYHGLIKDNGKWYLAKTFSTFDEVHDTEVKLVYIENIRNYFTDFLELRDKLSFELKMSQLFDYDFALQNDTKHISEKLGYKTNQDIYSLVHSYDRKLLKTKSDSMNRPIRLLNANNEYQYFIVPISHSPNYSLISFPEYPSIINTVEYPDRYIPLPTSLTTFLFWCYDPLSDRIIGTIGSPSIQSLRLCQNLSDVSSLVFENDRQAFIHAVNDLILSQNNISHHMFQFVIEDRIRYFDIELTLTSEYLITILGHDVTEHKQILESTTEATQLIDTGLLYSNVLIWYFNDDRNEELVYTTMPIAHKPFNINWSTIEFNVVLEDQSKLTKQLRDALDSSSNVVDIEIPVMFDKIKWYMMRGMKKNNENQLMGILVDTTELKSLSAQAKQQKLRAEEANSAKSRFLANMSHEIRTPLSGMSGLLELLEGTYLPPDAQEIVSCIRISFTKLLDLLNDTLDLAKMDQKKMIPQIVSFKTFETLLPLISGFEQRATSNHIELHINASPKLPIMLSGDPHFLARITTNLIANSLKFTDTGFVSVFFSYEDDNFIIEVEDTGVGYLPEEIDKIYEPFPLINSSSDRAPRGIGACTALVKRMVDALNGKISFTTEINKGTKFTVQLPFEALMSPYVCPSIRKKHYVVLNLCPHFFLENHFEKHFVDFYGFDIALDNQKINYPKLRLIVCQYQELETALSISKNAPNSKIILITNQITDSTNPIIHIFRMSEFWIKIQHFLLTKVIYSHEVEKKTISDDFRILVAEDNSMNQLIIKKILEKMGRKFRIVGNGSEAIDALNAGEKFNLILMDHQMPILDGPSATKQIRASDKWYKDIPIIAMTASTLKEDEDECINSGMNHFLSKPISKVQLEEEILFAAGLPFNVNQ